MDAQSAAITVGGIVAVLVVLGFLGRAVRGRAQRIDQPRESAAELVPLSDLAAGATLVQFVTETCTKCPGVARTLGAIAAGRPGVRHITVDLTHRLDLARSQRVLATPTTVILDAAGRERARVVGVPRAGVIEAEISHITGAPHV